MASTEEVMGRGTQAFHEHKTRDKGIPPWSDTPRLDLYSAPDLVGVVFFCPLIERQGERAEIFVFSI